jgi:hypothetical protein
VLKYKWDDQIYIIYSHLAYQQSHMEFFSF